MLLKCDISLETGCALSVFLSAIVFVIIYVDECVTQTIYTYWAAFLNAKTTQPISNRIRFCDFVADAS